jgi:hypothetical protein
LFNRLPLEQRERVLAEFRPIDLPDAEFSASFDFVLGRLPAQG